MNTYHVHANHCDCGVIDADSEQEARDIAAQMAGYASEQDMVSRLDAKSEIIADSVGDES